MECGIDGCNKVVFNKGKQLCAMHYSRWHRTGSTDDTYRSHGPFKERFWRNVKKAGSDECWLWAGPVNNMGYGHIHQAERGEGKILAHRAAWELHTGKRLGGSAIRKNIIMHRCDNPRCVNPRHLLRGTQKDNMRDMVKKGRMHKNHLKGAAHPNAKLTEKQVRHIRSSDKSHTELSKKFGVTVQAIWSVRNKGWRSVSEEKS